MDICIYLDEPSLSLLSILFNHLIFYIDFGYMYLPTMYMCVIVYNPCPMPRAPCPMPHAPCPMPRATLFCVYGRTRGVDMQCLQAVWCKYWTRLNTFPRDIHAMLTISRSHVLFVVVMLRVLGSGYKTFFSRRQYCPSRCSRLFSFDSPSFVAPSLAEPKSFGKDFSIPDRLESPLPLEQLNPHENDRMLSFDETCHRYTFDGKRMKNSVTQVMSLWK